MGRIAYLLPCLLALTGCASPGQPEAPHVIQVRIPAALTVPCLHEAAPETNGELLLAYEDARLALAECNERMQAIRSINSPEVDK